MELPICVLCLLSIYFTAQTDSEDFHQGCHCTDNFPTLTYANLVQQAARSTDNSHHPTPQGTPNLPTLGTRRPKSNIEKFKSLCSHSLRKTLKSRELSEKVTDFICRYRSQKSVLACATYVNRWIQFCLERKIHPHKSALGHLMEYYMYLQEIFPSPASLSCYITGMKKYLSEKSVSLLKHPLFEELKYASRIAAAELPKCPLVSWDPDKVLDFMLTLSNPSEMNKVKLSRCCLVLLLLSSGRCKIDLHRLDMSKRHMQKTEDCFYFAMRKLPKCHWGNMKNDFMQYLEFPKYPFDKHLCPYYMLECYIKYV